MTMSVRQQNEIKVALEQVRTNCNGRTRIVTSTQERSPEINADEFWESSFAIQSCSILGDFSYRRNDDDC